MNSQNIKGHPELLAPAGSIESFHAAINAGADAVYLGLDVFNARLRAKNFTIKTLSYLAPYAHSRGIKIYVTLNTMIKQSELELLIHVLYQLEQIGVDALIVADLGLIELARSQFPSLKLHGSTQMAVHNSAGMSCAEKLGLSRVVLARELTIKEISRITAESPLQVEVFIHGALCYSISGMCLASSFIGGASGNRGMCTQVCRRKFREKTSTAAGYFFSPSDLCGIDYLSSLKDAGVSSLKIEGRMKGPEYVDTVVRAYRVSIDNPQRITEAKNTLAFDLGRPKTSFFLSGVSSDNLINHKTASGTGLLIGKIIKLIDSKIVVSGIHDLSNGDRIRIHPEDGFEGVAVNVAGSEIIDGTLIIELKAPMGKTGDLVYLVSRKSAQTKLSTDIKITSAPVPFKSSYSSAKNLLYKLKNDKPVNKSRDELWVKTDSAEWLDHLLNTPCQHLIFSASSDAMQSFLEDQPKLKVWRSRLIPALPPFVSDKEIDGWKRLISRFIKEGIKKFACNNIGQLKLFPPKTELIADNPLWILNSASQKAIHKLGFKWFSYSTEDEYLNIKDCASANGILYIYSHIPLFISRIKHAAQSGAGLCDPHGNCFFTSEKHGLYYLLSRKPLCLTHKAQKLHSFGISNFLIDLSFTEPDSLLLQNIINAYKTGTKMPDSSMFNFKAGVK